MQTLDKEKHEITEEKTLPGNSLVKQETRKKVSKIIEEKNKIIKINHNLTPLEQFEFIKKKSQSFLELGPLVEYLEKGMPMSTEERRSVLEILDMSFMKLISLTSSIKQELDELEKIAKGEDIGELVPLKEIATEDEIGDMPNIDIIINEEKILEDEQVVEKRRKKAEKKEEKKQRKLEKQKISSTIGEIKILIKNKDFTSAFILAKTLEEVFPKNKEVTDLAVKCRKLSK